ncbi:MAG: response regulator transcription factor [Proteobacteria bacterium]|nr:response regulator transcription factor [Pseudomonadota bacterium]
MRILYADDHSLIREALKPHLMKLRAKTEVIEAGSVDEALQYAKDVDLVLLDLQMPGMNGFEGFDRVKAALPDVPIVIVSGYSDKRTINAALERGASGFVPKTATGKTLIRALEAVLDGERYIPASLLEESDAPSIFDQTAKRTGPIEDSPLNKLTEREAEALRLLIAGKTNKQIAIDLGLQEITVKIHLRNCYKKIGATNRADAVRLAYEHGWRVPGET